METTSRETIKHLIRRTHPTDVPTLPAMSNATATRLIEYLNGSRPKNKLVRIRTIYALVDQITRELSVDSVCRKGCAWCCMIPVEVSPLEVKYIEANTNRKRARPLIDYVTPEGQEHNVGYCPLLDQSTGCCSVYDYRPINCRTFFVYDSPEYCKRGTQGEALKHWTSGGPENGFGNKGLLRLALDLVEADIGRPLSWEVKPLVESRIKDIRCYFG